jgi:hypothetical protein
MTAADLNSAVNPGNTRNTSRAFFLAYLRCMEQRTDSQQQLQFLAAPAVANATFSIELGLKALLAFTGNTARGHKLNELFATLPAGLRAAIANRVGGDRGRFDQSLPS